MALGRTGVLGLPVDLRSAKLLTLPATTNANPLGYCWSRLADTGKTTTLALDVGWYAELYWSAAGERLGAHETTQGITAV